MSDDKRTETTDVNAADEAAGASGPAEAVEPEAAAAPAVTDKEAANAAEATTDDDAQPTDEPATPHVSRYVAERRPGDWLRRDIRRERAEEMRERDRAAAAAEPWHRRTGPILLLCFLFWPVGVVLLWRSSMPLWAKALVSALIVFFVVQSMRLATIANTMTTPTA